MGFPQGVDKTGHEIGNSFSKTKKAVECVVSLVSINTTVIF